MSYSLTVLSFRQSASKQLSITKIKKALLWVFLLTMLSESAAWAKLPVAFGTRQFQVILPTVSLEDSGVLKFLFAHFAGKSYLVHYMYHCLVFSQSFNTNKSLTTFYAQVFIWDEIWVIIVSRPCVLIQSVLNKCECRIAMILWRVLPLLIFNN